MSGRIVTLNAAKGGINRQRVKGGADANTLYDLVNGYVDQAGVLRSRPGSQNVNTMPAQVTKGMCAYDGMLIVFSHLPQDLSDSTPPMECEVLRHPSMADMPIKDVHFAGPYLGFLYVVPEFENGDVFHYWLQRGTTWAATTAYLPGALVMPTDARGIAYQLDSGTESYAPWVKSVPRALGDVVVPTVDDGFKYTVTDLFGPSPKSGAIEPTWPAVDGGTTFEDSDVEVPAPISSGQSGATLPPAITDRYGTGRTGPGTNEAIR